jgi:replicative DNA helicase
MSGRGGFDGFPAQLAMPHQEEAEKAVLAAVLVDASTLPAVAARLKAEDFYLERHQLLFGAMLELADEGSPIDVRTLQAKLEPRDGAFQRIGGVAYLASLELDLPDLGRVDTYAEIVKDRATRRRLVQLASGAVRDATTGDEPSFELMAKLQAALVELAGGAMIRGLRPIALAVQDLVAKIESSPTELRGAPSGFAAVDDGTNGLVPGNLFVIAGRTGFGKTTYALQVFRHFGLELKRPAAFFSLEMTEEELAMSLLVAMAEVPFELIRAGEMSQNQWRRLMVAAQQLDQAPLYVDDSPATVLDVAAKAHELRAERGVDLVVVDYLQLLKPDRRFENRNLQVGADTRRLKELAKMLHVPLVCLSQLSRQSAHRGGDHRPQLQDLRESGEIEQHADVVLFVHRPEIYEPTNPDVRGLAELIRAKVRRGKTGIDTMRFRGEVGKFVPRGGGAAAMAPTPPPVRGADPF